MQTQWSVMMKNSGNIHEVMINWAPDPPSNDIQRSMTINWSNRPGPISVIAPMPESVVVLVSHKLDSHFRPLEEVKENIISPFWPRGNNNQGSKTVFSLFFSFQCEKDTDLDDERRRDRETLWVNWICERTKENCSSITEVLFSFSRWAPSLTST